MDAATVTQITTSVTENMATASALTVTVGLALIGIAFLGFVLRKAKRAANGRV